MEFENYVDLANELVERIGENPEKYREELIKIFGEDFEESLQDNEDEDSGMPLSEIAGDFINGLYEKNINEFIKVIDILIKF